MRKARVTITLTTGNSEMTTGSDVEMAVAATLAAAYLGDIGNMADAIGRKQPIFDVNGNTVGELRVTRA
jgi:hypothetical protein